MYPTTCAVRWGVISCVISGVVGARRRSCSSALFHFLALSGGSCHCIGGCEKSDTGPWNEDLCSKTVQRAAYRPDFPSDTHSSLISQATVCNCASTIQICYIIDLQPHYM